jgi:cobalt/nickel transport system ATP-binding protein
VHRLLRAAGSDARPRSAAELHALLDGKVSNPAPG